MQNIIPQEKKSIIEKIINWRLQHLSDRQLTLILSFFVGLFAAIAAFVLHTLIHQIQLLLTRGFSITSYNWLYLVFPIIGIYLTSLFVRHIIKDKISHGITRVLYAIATNKSKLKSHNCWSSVFASAITIGFGGSVGAEAPIVLTGSAIGSNLGQLFRLDNKSLMLLVGCGASAAIAGIFKAPIAGMVFTLEVLMVDLTMASILPILISCVTATCFAYVFIGSSSLFSFHLENAWLFEHIPACIILGVFCAICSLYFIRMMNHCEGYFAKLDHSPIKKLIIGGLLLSTLISFFPVLYGEGYSAINILLNGNTETDWNAILYNSLFYNNSKLLLLYVGLVILTKVFATSATNGSGGCGGTFAPSLFIGAFSGFFFARFWNEQQIATYIPEKNFALMGMAGVMTGVMHSPLTGIFLIAEITGGYQLLLPLMIVCISSYLVINIFEPHSIYAMRLARQGKLITHDKDKAALTLLDINNLIEKEYLSVSPEMPLGKLVQVISRSNIDYIPVVDKDGSILGEIDIIKTRHIVFRTELYKRFTVSQITSPVQEKLTVNEATEDIMKKFDRTNANFLPVVEMNNHLIGFISRNKMYTNYRKIISDLSED